jgi:tRNA (cytidine32/uridine32-2'-O)-methyltransferase
MNNPARLDHISIILNEPRYARNIGSVCRAMKNMGLTKLVVVNPENYDETEARRLAVGGEDILQSIIFCDRLEKALGDKHVILGTTTATRESFSPKLDTQGLFVRKRLTPREMADMLAGISSERQVAILFGSENNGLRNEELALCHATVTIPTGPAYSSINLAMSVMICAYELFLRFKDVAITPAGPGSEAESLVSQAEIQLLYEELSAFLQSVDFLVQKKPQIVLKVFESIFSRTLLTRAELNLLRGLFRKLKEYQNEKIQKKH